MKRRRTLPLLRKLVVRAIRPMARMLRATPTRSAATFARAKQKTLPAAARRAESSCIGASRRRAALLVARCVRLRRTFQRSHARALACAAAREAFVCVHVGESGASVSTRAGEGMSVLGITCSDCWDISCSRPAGLRGPFVGAKLLLGRRKSWRFARLGARLRSPAISRSSLWN